MLAGAGAGVPGGLGAGAEVAAGVLAGTGVGVGAGEGRRDETGWVLGGGETPADAAAAGWECSTEQATRPQ